MVFINVRRVGDYSIPGNAAASTAAEMVSESARSIR
jgi:hypothetical protein